MGSTIEFNDTLKISHERGFPTAFKLEDNLSHADLLARVKDQRFSFWNPDERIYHRAPTPVLLVQEMPEKKWVYWGRAQIIKQTIDGDSHRTEGVYVVSQVFPPEHREILTRLLAPEGKSYY